MIRTRLQAFRDRCATPARAGAVAVLLLATSCGEETSGPRTDYDAIDPIVYSEHVQPLFNMSCNTAFCHNAEDAASGLSLASYESLSAGSRFGAMVTPFKPDLSHLYLHLTGDIEPVMPLGRGRLSDDVIRFFRRWIEDGAREDDGRAMYDDVTRKAFVACQGENAVAVVDMDTGLLVRILDVDQPHSVYVHAPTRRLYVSRFETASDNIHIYDADTYERIGFGRAGTFPALMQVTPDGEQLWVTNFDSVGSDPDHAVRVLDPDTLAEIASFTIPGAEQPHGLAMTGDGSRVYVCNILSDNVSIFTTNPLDVLTFGLQLPDAGGMIQEPQQCVLSSDESRLFVSALKANKVYVMNTATGEFTADVTVGLSPWHITLSPAGDELWVANWEGESLSIVDVTDPDQPLAGVPLRPLNPQDPERPVIERPIGIAFSPDGSRVYVANANDDNQGSGHHPPPEGEKNPGSVAVFDASTREVLSVAEVPNFARFVSFLP